MPVVLCFGGGFLPRKAQHKLVHKALKGVRLRATRKFETIYAGHGPSIGGLLSSSGMFHPLLMAFGSLRMVYLLVSKENEGNGCD